MAKRFVKFSVHMLKDKNEVTEEMVTKTIEDVTKMWEIIKDALSTHLRHKHPDHPSTLPPTHPHTTATTKASSDDQQSPTHPEQRCMFCFKKRSPSKDSKYLMLKMKPMMAVGSNQASKTVEP